MHNLQIIRGIVKDWTLLDQIDLHSPGKLNYVLDIHVQYVLFVIRMKMVFSRIKKDLLLVFSFSKLEFQLPMKNEEAGHECAIWFELAHLG